MGKGNKKEFKNQSDEQLKAGVYQLEREIFELRNELAVQRKLEKPHLIREKRKEKARMLTILTQQKEGNKGI